MRAASLIMIVALTACETDPPIENLSVARPRLAALEDGTVIFSIPDKAVLTHPNGACRTPCEVRYPEKVQVTLAKEGFAPMLVNIPVGARDTILELRPVGRSTAVEEVSLPEL
ncbi:MAG: hypothetical protein AAGG79_06890 [Pseudomonadota bacterium]